MREATKLTDLQAQKDNFRHKNISNNKRDIEIKLKELSDRIIDISKKLAEIVDETSSDDNLDLSLKIHKFLHLLTYNEHCLTKYMESGHGVMQLEELIDQLELTILSKINITKERKDVVAS